MQNQRVLPGKVKKGSACLKLMQNQRVQPGKVECLLKVNAESTGPPWKGEEGECLPKVNAESTGPAGKVKKGSACLK
ncbi:hypothetical protein CRG98_016816 [Punica granatum]|uniref:Uncharacterized protein n=1 Tax=Punica granatum TaxID=22663 RepID=A0A2I0K2L6_PUNGR|nr:hypothetical protein CRG98_016816 [Punica granatum]